MDDDTDAELVARARAGELDAFRVLAERYRPMVRSLAWGEAGAYGVEDLVQETLLQAWVSLDGLRDGTRFRSWLYGIALNVRRNWRRRESALPMVLDEEAGGIADPYDAVDQLVVGVPLLHARHAVDAAAEERLEQQAARILLRLRLYAPHLTKELRLGHLLQIWLPSQRKTPQYRPSLVRRPFPSRFRYVPTRVPVLKHICVPAQFLVHRYRHLDLPTRQYLFLAYHLRHQRHQISSSRLQALPVSGESSREVQTQLPKTRMK